MLKIRLLLPAMIGSVVVACSSQGTIGSLNQVETEELQEVEIDQLSHQQIRDQYQEILGLVDDDYIKEQIERRISGVHMQESDARSANPNNPPAQGYYRNAIASYRDILEKYPNSPDNAEVLYQLAKAYDIEGQPDNALTMMRRLEKFHPDYEHMPEVYFRMGDLHFNAARYPQAEKAYRKTAQYNKASLNNNAHYMLAWTLYKQGAFDKSLEEFTWVLNALHQEDGSTAELNNVEQSLIDDTLHSMSLALVNLGGAEAIRDVSQLKNRAYVWRLYEQLAGFYLKKNLYSDSAATYREFIDRFPMRERTSRFHTELISVYVKGAFPKLVLEEKEIYANQYGPESDYYARFPQLQDDIRNDLKGYYVELASHYHSQGQQALAQHKKKPKEAHLSELGEKSLVSATDFYQRYLTLFVADKANAEIRFKKAEAQFENQQYGLAASDYQQVAYGYPQSADTQVEYKLANKAGYAAIVSYQAHIETLENNKASRDDINQWRAASLESMLKFTEVFHEDVRSTAVLTNASQAMFDLKQYERAIKVASGLLENAENSNTELKKTAFGILAQSRFSLKQYSLAASNYQAQRKLMKPASKEYRQASNNIATSVYQHAEILKQQQKINEAIPQLLSLKTLAPDTDTRVVAQYDAASMLLADQRWDEAIAELQQLKSVYPKHTLSAEFPRKLAFAYESKKDWPQSLLAYEYLFNNDPDAGVKQEALFIAAGLAEKTGDDKKAISYYRDYAHKYEQPFDNRMEARYKLASLYEKQKDYNRQLFWLRRIVQADKKAGDQRTERSQWLGAWASTKYGDYFAWEFNRRKLRLPIEKSIARKNQFLQDAQTWYSGAADYGILEFTSQSNHTLGKLYQKFADELLAAPTPESLSAADKALFTEIFQQQSEPLQQLSQDYYMANLELAWQGHYNNWIQQSFDTMRELSPLRFDRTEQVAHYGDEIR
ncbi:tetratricopeptide repeat protein [Bacterioplanoides sp. SCSIO 12839]|uniref:tetratricopeptide repeat protein n=1 Tax=Bacterioplanoides sp. SCSIO 12839 TaxID=2829569 RepID=UPI002104EE91|nr:tetratricopeptide repeat protein [Bacterioplanoides sp. SCSIO 12839]UTW48444.1 tetratricopeptide repeat protein [Bacterioplanoides sp. SCSIO 12839]